MTTQPFILPSNNSSLVDQLKIGGDWTLNNYTIIKNQIQAFDDRLSSDFQADINEINALDTAGATLLVELLGEQRLNELTNKSNLPAEKQNLLLVVGKTVTEAQQAPLCAITSTSKDFFEHVGVAVEDIWNKALELFSFFGLVVSTMATVFFSPRRWRLTPLTSHLENNGLRAVPIVALLTFMVGAVVAFLGSSILSEFGATIYTVDLVAFSFLREFGVLLTAILMAGRTASAFTAQIGSMQANEEIDALRTLGLDPIEFLVLPRIFSLLIALPILTFIAIICGLAGGAAVCILTLDISATTYISLLHAVDVRHFIIGMAKAPVFAFSIAMIGCNEGFKVTGSAQSVGERTTSSVVQSIFVVILLDAVFALFAMGMGW